MSSGIRGNLKSLIPEKMWPFFRFMDRYIIYLLYVYFAAKRYIFRSTQLRHSLGLQKIPTVTSQVDLGMYPGEKLEEQIVKAGIEYKSGRHSIYIDSAHDISKINCELLTRYPYPIGLKLIKSLELSSDKTPYYTSHKLAPASTWFSVRAVGSMLEQSIVSNLLHEHHVAPRVYDIIRLESEDGSWCYAYVLQPVKGPVITGQKGEKFITHFKDVLVALGMETVSIKEHCDLRPPDFRHNIRCDSTGIYYVDIQNFVFSSNVYAEAILPIGEDRIDSQKNAIRENCEESAGTFSSFFAECGLKIDDIHFWDYELPDERLVLTVLAEGGRWCDIVRPAEVVHLLRQYLFYHGFSRFDLHNAELNSFVLETVFEKKNMSVLMVCDSYLKKNVHKISNIPIEYLLVVHSNMEKESDCLDILWSQNLGGKIVKTGNVFTVCKDISKVSLIKMQ